MDLNSQKIKGSENKYMYVCEIFLQSYPKKIPIYKLAKIKGSNYSKLPISEMKRTQIWRVLQFHNCKISFVVIVTEISS